MLLRTTDPFRDFDRLTQQFFGTTNRPAVMPMDAWREGDRFVVEFDLPGISPESIDLDVERNVLTVRAERVARNGRRSWWRPPCPRGRRGSRPRPGLADLGLELARDLVLDVGGGDARRAAGEERGRGEGEGGEGGAAHGGPPGPGDPSRAASLPTTRPRPRRRTTRRGPQPVWTPGLDASAQPPANGGRNSTVVARLDDTVRGPRGDGRSPTITEQPASTSAKRLSPRAVATRVGELGQRHPARHLEVVGVGAGGGSGRRPVAQGHLPGARRCRPCRVTLDILSHQWFRVAPPSSLDRPSREVPMGTAAAADQRPAALGRGAARPRAAEPPGPDPPGRGQRPARRPRLRPDARRRPPRPRARPRPVPADPHDRRRRARRAGRHRGRPRRRPADWGMDDVVLDTSGPAELDARIRLAIGRLARRSASRRTPRRT